MPGPWGIWPGALFVTKIILGSLPFLFLKKMIREETVLENLAEEMRILYVALTRAKEKLIMTGAA